MEVVDPQLELGTALAVAAGDEVPAEQPAHQQRVRAGHLRHDRVHGLEDRGGAAVAAPWRRVEEPVQEPARFELEGPASVEDSPANVANPEVALAPFVEGDRAAGIEGQGPVVGLDRGRVAQPLGEAPGSPQGAAHFALSFDLEGPQPRPRAQVPRTVKSHQESQAGGLPADGPGREAARTEADRPRGVLQVVQRLRTLAQSQAGPGSSVAGGRGLLRRLGQRDRLGEVELGLEWVLSLERRGQREHQQEGAPHRCGPCLRSALSSASPRTKSNPFSVLIRSPASNPSRSAWRRWASALSRCLRTDHSRARR